MSDRAALRQQASLRRPRRSLGTTRVNASAVCDRRYTTSQPEVVCTSGCDTGPHARGIARERGAHPKSEFRLRTPGRGSLSIDFAVPGCGVVNSEFVYQSFHAWCCRSTSKLVIAVCLWVALAVLCVSYSLCRQSCRCMTRRIPDRSIRCRFQAVGSGEKLETATPGLSPVLWMAALLSLSPASAPCSAFGAQQGAGSAAFRRLRNSIVSSARRRPSNFILSVPPLGCCPDYSSCPYFRGSDEAELYNSNG